MGNPASTGKVIPYRKPVLMVGNARHAALNMGRQKREAVWCSGTTRGNFYFREGQMTVWSDLQWNCVPWNKKGDHCDTPFYDHYEGDWPDWLPPLPPEATS